MAKKREIIVLVVLFSSLFYSTAYSENQRYVLINEIAWMGNANSANDEWIELFNNSNNTIDLTGWSLKSSDDLPAQAGKLKINLKGQIPAKGFYLLERTDDNSVPDITADIIYTGALNNTGLDLKLYDNFNNLIDQANFVSGWPFGNNTTKQTMERTEKLAWQTSKEPSGTPGAQNSPGLTESSKTQEEAIPEIKSNTEPIEAESVKIYPEGVVINEILPAPEGPDETNEYIELYNNNNFNVDLKDWKIEDAQGTITIYIFPKGTKIKSFGYLVLKRPETKIILNNDGDRLNLILPDGKIIDSVFYANAPKNQSYNKIYPVRNEVFSGVNSIWQWSKTLTPDSVNITEQTLPKSNKTANNIAAVSIKDSANIGEITNPIGNEVSNGTSPWFLFLTAIAVTIISGIIILTLKLKIFKRGKELEL